jgi:hypothetical protein
MGKYFPISSYIGKPFLILYMTLQLLYSEFPYIWGRKKNDYLFCQCSKRINSTLNTSIKASSNRISSTKTASTKTTSAKTGSTKTKFQRFESKSVSIAKVDWWVS